MTDLSPTARPRPWKKLLFRLVAVALSLSPLLIAEGACRALDWGRPTGIDDPFVGFSDVHPLFVRNDATGRYEIPSSRLLHFCFDSFAADKPADEYRVFVLGGSTVQGAPYEIETSFTTWLELSLQAAAPERRWEVVNCGGTSYASYRLVPILQEVLGYDPDLIILCSGHNEFLEDRSYDHIKHAPALLSWPQRQAARLRVYNLLRGAYLNLTDTPDEPPADRPTLPAEVDAWLDFRGGMAKYHRDDDWKRGVIDHYEFNLRRMVAMCAEAGVPVLLACPVSNLDFPPFKSEHREDMSAADRETFDALLDQSTDHMQEGAYPAALELLHQAEQIDDRHARLNYALGKCYQRLGQLPEAKRAFLRAIDEDICPLRMTAEMMEIIKNVADETGTPFVDAHGLIAVESPGGITGPRWLVDHVHPTIEGHKHIADALLAELVRQEVVDPAPGWEEARQAAYRQHMEDLHPSYFPRAQQRLHGLRLWTSGRVRLDRERYRAAVERGETPWERDPEALDPDAGKGTP